MKRKQEKLKKFIALDKKEGTFTNDQYYLFLKLNTKLVFLLTLCYTVYN